jgi:methylated-DNA-[protein]-cysteine S-methyltransferase
MTVSHDLDSRFRDAATAAGLVDVSYDVVQTPIGDLLVAATERGLCRIVFDPEPDREAESLARGYGVRVLRSPRAVDPARRQLDEYFDGSRQEFELATDLRIEAPFRRNVLAELAKVPFGATTTYGTLARRAGRPRSARAVGVVMNRNPIPIVLPCHRVVGADGRLVGYGGGIERKEALLRLEGALA